MEENFRVPLSELISFKGFNVRKGDKMEQETTDIKYRTPTGRWTKAAKIEVRKLLSNGNSASKIQQLTGVPLSTVNSWRPCKRRKKSVDDVQPRKVKVERSKSSGKELERLRSKLFLYQAMYESAIAFIENLINDK